MPPKPAIKPMDLDWECSPFSLCSPPRSSTNSTSHVLESPLQLEATGTISSPAIYDSSVFGSHSPSNSPLEPISSLMFSSHIRNMHGDPTPWEDLSVADLLRLEISATRVQAESTPIIQASSDGRAIDGLGFEMPSPTPQLPIIVFHPFQLEAQDWLSAFSPSHSENVIDFENTLTGNSRHPSHNIQGGCRLEVPIAGNNRKELTPHVGTEDIHMEVVEKKIISNERSENSGREFVGLGLGDLAGGSLQSSGSISRLYVVPSPSGGKLSGERAMEGSSLNNIFNGRYRSPGTFLLILQTKLRLMCIFKASRTVLKPFPILDSFLHVFRWGRSIPATSTSITCRSLHFKQNVTFSRRTKQPRYTKISLKNGQNTTLTPEKDPGSSNLVLSWKKKEG